MQLVLRAEEINFVVYRYLVEEGYTHAAYTFQNEAKIPATIVSAQLPTPVDTNTRIRQKAHFPPHCLISLFQKAMHFMWLEYHTEKVTGKLVDCDEVFSLFKPHTCRRPPTTPSPGRVDTNTSGSSRARGKRGAGRGRKRDDTKLEETSPEPTEQADSNKGASAGQGVDVVNPSWNSEDFSGSAGAGSPDNESLRMGPASSSPSSVIQRTSSDMAELDKVPSMEQLGTGGKQMRPSVGSSGMEEHPFITRVLPSGQSIRCSRLSDGRLQVEKESPAAGGWGVIGRVSPQSGDGSAAVPELMDMNQNGSLLAVWWKSLATESGDVCLYTIGESSINGIQLTDDALRLMNVISISWRTSTNRNMFDVEVAGRREKYSINFRETPGTGGWESERSA